MYGYCSPVDPPVYVQAKKQGIDSKATRASFQISKSSSCLIFLNVPLVAVRRIFHMLYFRTCPLPTRLRSPQQPMTRTWGLSHQQYSRRYRRRYLLWMSLLLPWVTRGCFLPFSGSGPRKWGSSTKTLVISLSRDVLQPRSAPPFYSDHFCLHDANTRKLWRSCKRGGLFPIDPWGRKICS